jgi:CelD/BcsL family acetyltransferase involved in cellulose biosynthesis
MLQDPRFQLRLTGEVLGPGDMLGRISAWSDLCDRAVEDNVYYSPRFAAALLKSVESRTELRFAVVWDGPYLVAMLPFTSSRFAVPMVRPAARAWQSKYTYSCTPLLDRTCKAEAASALLNLMAGARGGDWVIPTLNVHGEACHALLDAIEREAFPWLFANDFQRASLSPGNTFEQHMQVRVSAKRRKDIARNRRGLEKLGRVEHHWCWGGEDLDRAVAAFLQIEKKGWKGQLGTALASSKATRQFALSAFTGSAEESICRADVLTLDDVPVAVSLTVFAGATGFTVKGAYDEAYRKHSAGLLLEVEVIRSFLSDRWAERLDSGTDGSHLIDSLWAEKVEVADLMFAVSPRWPGMRRAGLRVCNQAHQSMRSETKRLLEKVRRPSRPRPER